jgi:hypothetical protein
MFSPPREYSESRPFKVFVSLQDKWEIGASLTDAMILDTLRAIKKLLEIESRESEDVRAMIKLKVWSRIKQLIYPDFSYSKYSL